MRPKKLRNWSKNFLKKTLPFILLSVLITGGIFFLISKPKADLKEMLIKEPVAAIAGQEDFLLVDEDGAVLGRTPKTNLPVIFGSQAEDERIKKAIDILLAFQLNLWEAGEIRLSSERYLEIKLKDNLEIIFSLQKETQIQLDSLQLIFSRAKIEGRKIKKIDLRFDKPVVSYE